MSAGTSSFCLIVCLLVCSSGAQTNIRAELGQEVVLPCKVPDNININNIRAVEWIRPDLDPDYVLFYRDGRLDPEHQHPSYQNRVDLQDKEMKDGNVSLILKNVMKNDTGRYECRVYEIGKKDSISNIYLEVLLSAQEITGAEKITADLGHDVVLPCKASKKNNITAVEWIRLDHDPGYVLFYRDGRFDPDNQHPSYQNRVDLQDEEMKDGNVSLVLKNVMMEDTGTYECLIFQRKTNALITIINLEVLPSGDKDAAVGVIVGSVFGVILFLLVVASAVFLYVSKCRRPKRQNQHRPVPAVQPPSIEMSPVPEVPPEQPTASEHLMEHPAEEQTQM